MILRQFTLGSIAVSPRTDQPRDASMSLSVVLALESQGGIGSARLNSEGVTRALKCLCLAL